MKPRDLELIRALMRAQNMSARTLSGRIGWSSHSYLNRILAGSIKSVRPDVAARIAEALGVDVKVLFVPKVPRNAGQNANGRAA